MKRMWWGAGARLDVRRGSTQQGHRVRTRFSTRLAVCVGFVIVSLGWTLPAASAATADVTEYSDGISGGASPYGIATGPDGNLWFTENTGGRIGRLDPTTGVVTEFSAGISSSPGLWGIAAGPDGNVWFAESQASRIGRITPDGTVTEYPTGGVPTGVTAGPDGNVWFTEYSGNRIGRIDPTTGVIREYGIPSAGALPWSITAGPDGNLWFTEKGVARIGRINPTTGVVTEYRLTGDAGPLVIASGPDGNLWFTEYSGARIGRIDPTTGVVTEFSISTPLPRPQGIVAGPDGNMWFTEWAADRIGRITPDGEITDFAVGNQNLVKPYLITAGPNGDLWFTENPGNQIARMSVVGQLPSDATPPQTTISLDPASPNGNDQWYTSAVGVSIAATDGGSGVAATRCALDPATAPATFGDLPATDCRYLEPGASVTADGSHTLWAASIDTAGNAETPISTTFGIDATAPTVTCGAPPTFPLGSTGNHVTATVTDDTSGPADPSVSASAPATSSGAHSVNVTGEDKAGNSTTVPCSYVIAYDIQPSDGGFLPPAPQAKWKAGSSTPIKIALGSADGKVIGDAEAAGLAADCRVTFSAVGVQTLAPTCMKYDSSKHQFIYPWKLDKQPLGTDTVTVTITYANTAATTTRTATITITA